MQFFQLNELSVNQFQLNLLERTIYDATWLALLNISLMINLSMHRLIGKFCVVLLLGVVQYILPVI